MQAQQQRHGSQGNLIVTLTHMKERVDPQAGNNRTTDEIRLG